MKRSLFIALLCAAAQLIWADPTIVTTDADLRAAVQTNNADIRVDADIDLSNSTLSIESGLTVTIDLNGHKLDRKLTKRGEGGGQVITVRQGATLNLSNGTLAGGWGGNAGGLSNESGTVNLTDVTITGCTGVNAGGGICNLGGTLTMTGGAITNNISQDDKVHSSDHTGGGGLFNEEGATATLTNVTISGNTAAIYGGGGICNYGTLSLNGCAIQGNRANTNGGAIWEEGTLNIQGANLISANKGGTASDGIDDDIYLWTDRLIHVTGSLEGSVIRVHMKQPGVFTDGYSTYNNGVNPATIFTSEVPTAITVVLDGDEAKFASALPEGTVYYIERSWDEANKKVTSEIKTLPSGMYTVMTGGDDISITPGYYVVNSNIERDDIILSSGGEYHLILCDGCQVKADIVNVAPGKTLYVYGQAANTGRLYIPYGNDDEGEREACIGGRRNESCGTVIIHGGDVYAEGRYGAATIGGGMGGNGGTVTIFGGTVYAKGGGSYEACGAGIGSGYMGDGGTVTIYGGKVTAETPWGGAGIGAGSNHDSGGGAGPFAPRRIIKRALQDDVHPHNGGTVNIYGGEVYAYAGAGAAGIGGGDNAGGANVTINGGIVKAYGGENGAGIGTGHEYGDIRYNGKLTVNGGEVYAYGGDDAAGIGGGYDASGSEVIINGGYVYAKGAGNGAGIGSGCESIYKGGLQGGKLTVNGGEVYAYGGVDAAGIGGGEDADGGTVIITGGYVLAQGNDWGAGIGGGQDGDGGKVTITGGTVIAKAGRNETECRAIGPGEGCDVYGSLTLGDDMMVTSERKFTAPERKNACWYRTQVRVEPCDHEGATYTVDGTTATDHHISHCSYCLHSDTALHTFDGHGVCTVCGVHGEVKAVVMWLPKAPFDGQTYGPTSTHSVVPNTRYTLPLPSIQVPGYQFIGWEATNEPSGISYTSPYTTDTATLYPTGSRYTISEDIDFVARYKVSDITLYDDVSNSDALAEFNDMTVNSATLSGRTLTKDNTWQTLALPFALDAEALASSPLAGCELKQLDLEGYYDAQYNRYAERAEGRDSTHYDLVTNTLYLYFKDATAVEAGKPYVVRWASPSTLNSQPSTIEDPVFANVTITNQSASVYAPHCTLVSLYNPKTFANEEPNVVYMGANSAFLQPDGTETVTIGSFRGYVKLSKFYVLQAAADPLTIITNLDGAVVPTDVENVNLQSEIINHKFIKNGMLFIHRDGKTYTVTGRTTND